MVKESNSIDYFSTADCLVFKVNNRWPKAIIGTSICGSLKIFLELFNRVS